MTKYGMEIVMETKDQYKTVRFSITDEPTPEQAEDKLNKWIKKHQKLLDKAANKEIHTLVFE